MAKFYPPLSVIKNFKVQPTEGEWKLLEFLSDTYGNDYEVFFQPFLNEARPDVIVMRKGGGVLIIEVKDWNLANYVSTPTGTWIVRANGEKLRNTPIRQVASYKEKLYNLNSWELFEQRILGGTESRRLSWGLVTCAVFFHKSTEVQVHALCFPENITDANKKFLKYIELLGDDSLTKKRFDDIFFRTYISRQSRYFSDALYDELFRLFSPDVHTVEQGIKYELTPAQMVLSVSEEGARKRIKGVAGSGKSFVLARRAINAHTRTGGTVLILTYNITLKNYLHDRMSEVRENFDWRYFHIQNYHHLFNMMLTQCNLSIFDIARMKWPLMFKEIDANEDGGAETQVPLSSDQLTAIYADGSIFDSVSDRISKYDVILIDEAQDYQEEWIRIITKYVAAANAEIVAFADEKQNVYERKLDAGHFPVIPIATGRWDTSLNTTYRLNTEIAELAVLFQKTFFGAKYVIDDKIVPAKQMELVFNRAHIEYHFLPPKVNKNSVITHIAEFIQTVMRLHGLHVNDITVLGSSIELIRELGDTYERLSNERINAMCETQKEFEKVGGLPRKLKEIRQFKKLNFWQNRGSVAFSSIHSFKGLESPATVLIIGDGILTDENGFVPNNINMVKMLPELAYVGITRTRNYLYVINFGDDRYDTFFRSDSVRKLCDGISAAIPEELGGCQISNLIS